MVPVRQGTNSADGDFWEKNSLRVGLDPQVNDITYYRVAYHMSLHECAGDRVYTGGVLLGFSSES